VRPTPLRLRACALMFPLLAACAGTGGESAAPVNSVEAVGKVVDSLADEATRRAGADGFRGLPMVVMPASASGNAVELLVAEFLRTRLLERELVVQNTCIARCLEIVLQEFATSAPTVSQLTPGQILTVATGSVPILGSLARSLNDQDREAQRAAARTTGLLVTFAARDGARYTARSHVIAIVSGSGRDVALEQK